MKADYTAGQAKVFLHRGQNSETLLLGVSDGSGSGCVVLDSRGLEDVLRVCHGYWRCAAIGCLLPGDVDGCGESLVVIRGGDGVMLSIYSGIELEACVEIPHEDLQALADCWSFTYRDHLG